MPPLIVFTVYIMNANDLDQFKNQVVLIIIGES